MNNLALSFISDNGEQLCASCFMKLYKASEYKHLLVASTMTRGVNRNKTCSCGLTYGCDANVAKAEELLEAITND